MQKRFLVSLVYSNEPHRLEEDSKKDFAQLVFGLLMLVASDALAAVMDRVE